MTDSVRYYHVLAPALARAAQFCEKPGKHSHSLVLENVRVRFASDGATAQIEGTTNAVYYTETVPVVFTQPDMLIPASVVKKVAKGISSLSFEKPHAHPDMFPDVSGLWRTDPAQLESGVISFRPENMARILTVKLPFTVQFHGPLSAAQVFWPDLPGAKALIMPHRFVQATTAKKKGR